VGKLSVARASALDQAGAVAVAGGLKALILDELIGDLSLF
jgi:hypothetical protein